jgi:hypothetical protein
MGRGKTNVDPHRRCRGIGGIVRLHRTRRRLRSKHGPRKTNLGQTLAVPVRDSHPVLARRQRTAQRPGGHREQALQVACSKVAPGMIVRVQRDGFQHWHAVPVSDLDTGYERRLGSGGN